MVQSELQSYRLSSLEEPSDEMLDAVMKKVAISAKKSSLRAKAEHIRRLSQI